MAPPVRPSPAAPAPGSGSDRRAAHGWLRGQVERQRPDRDIRQAHPGAQCKPERVATAQAQHEPGPPSTASHELHDRSSVRLQCPDGASIDLCAIRCVCHCGRHVCSQILRSGTASAANYGEARGAESRADFIHKLRIVFKELNETTIWLEGIARSSMLRPDATAPVVAENRELCRVIASSIKTARATMEG